MNTLKITSAYIPLLIMGCSAGEKSVDNEIKKPNVLFIAIDDLRPELNCYGAEHIISPNIDMLASDGVLFTHAYTQQAVSAPSRNTLMTGLRPDALGITDLATFFRTKAPDVVTLSQYFIQNNYQAEGMGKIYHTGHGNSNDTLSWSNKYFKPNVIVNKRDPIQSGDTIKLHTCIPLINNKKLPWLNSPMPENMFDDALVAQHAMDRMEALKDTSFFLAVGFVKPHLPFVAPRKYWDLYDPSEIVIPDREKPNQHPDYSFSNWGELRKYHGMPAEGYVNDEDALNLIHGYYACVSFIDAQVGQLINKLKELDLYDNTIIVLWGDHGWKLGEYGEWCKHTNYEIDTRIPVIVKTAKENINKGFKSNVIIETVDIYPTICDLARLTKPNHLQGSSFKQALTEKDFEWEDVAISQYPRGTEINGENVKLMGYSMRTSKYRFIKWINVQTKETVAMELYDHTNPLFEMENLAYNQDYSDLMLELDKKFELEYQKEHRLDK